MTRYLILALVLASALSAAAPPDIIPIKEKAGVTGTNIPVKIGRAFLQGEIAQNVQVGDCGTDSACAAPSWLSTQSNIKNTWGDGSTQFAVVAFLIPSISGSQTRYFTFRSQGATCNCTPLTGAQMLAGGFDFDATIKLTNATYTPSGVTASARTILNAWGGSSSQVGPVFVWNPGSIAQTIIIGDHNNSAICNAHPCGTYDLGPGPNISDKSFRPVWHVTFWSGINKVQVRFIGENGQTEGTQDQVYDVVLKVGNASPTTVFSKTGFTHRGWTRWTVNHVNNTTTDSGIWIGGAPTTIPLAIDHNLNYLNYHTWLASYDTSFDICDVCGQPGNGTNGNNATGMTNIYSAWTSRAHNIGDEGNHLPSSNAAGTHPEVGPYDKWNVDWLYDMKFLDNRMMEVALGNAELDMGWPIFVREGKAGKRLLRSDPAGNSGLGHVVSVTDRRSLQWVADSAGAGDNIVPVGTVTYGNWINSGPPDKRFGNMDTGHIGQEHAIPYLLTGDFYHLEAMWLYASWTHLYPAGSSQATGTAASAATGRGPTGAEGGSGYIVSSRYDSRPLQITVETAAYTPTSLPEHTYFDNMAQDHLAQMAAGHNLTNSIYNIVSNPYHFMWTWTVNGPPTGGAKANWYRWDTSVAFGSACGGGFIYRGIWSSVTAYSECDVVLHCSVANQPCSATAASSIQYYSSTSSTDFDPNGLQFTVAASPNGATESANTVTLQSNSSAALHGGWQVGRTVTVSGVGVAGYNTNTAGNPSTFTITAIPAISACPLNTNPCIQVTDPTGGLSASGSGTVTLINIWRLASSSPNVAASIPSQFPNGRTFTGSVSPLSAWMPSSMSNVSCLQIDCSKASQNGDQTWEEHQTVYALKRAKDLGYADAELDLAYLCTYFDNMFVANKYYIGNNQGLPEINLNTQAPFTTWGQIASNINASNPEFSSWVYNASDAGGHANTASLVAYGCYGRDSGLGTNIYTTLKADLVTPSLTTTHSYESNPIYALAPRESLTATCAITPTSLPDAHIGTAYSTTITTLGCAAPTFSVSAGSLPTGDSLNASSGAITNAAPSGSTPTTSNFTIAVADANGNPTQALSIVTCTLPVITTTSPLTNATQNSAYTPVQFTATGDTGGTCTGCTWSATGVPAGMTLSSAGVLSGTPTALTTSTITVTATNTCGNSTTAALSLTIAAATVSSCPTGTACVTGTVGSIQGVVKPN